MKWYEKLKFARKVKGMTLREVEEETGISNSYLCQLERGQIKKPSFFKLVKLIELYNLDIGDLNEKTQ